MHQNHNYTLNKHIMLLYLTSSYSIKDQIMIIKKNLSFFMISFYLKKKIILDLITQKIK